LVPPPAKQLKQASLEVMCQHVLLLLLLLLLLL
jgi:hypothetical protein